MKITKSHLKKIIIADLLQEVRSDDEDRVSEMHEFSQSRSGKKVMQAGNKIRSAGNSIYEIAEDQTGKMRETLQRISEFVGKLGESLSGLNSLEEGVGVADTLPTIQELKQLQKDIKRLEQ